MGHRYSGYTYIQSVNGGKFKREIYILSTEDVTAFYRPRRFRILSESFITYVAAGSRTDTKHGGRSTNVKGMQITRLGEEVPLVGGDLDGKDASGSGGERERRRVRYQRGVDNCPGIMETSQTTQDYKYGKARGG